MSKFKGTKGEWVMKSNRQVAFSDEDFNIKDCDLYVHQYDDLMEMQYNAKLIAAAPELLEALTSFAMSMQVHPDCTEGSEFEDFVNNAFRVIKKATE